MSCLEDITVGSFVRGLIINDIAEIIALKRRGKSVLEVTFKGSTGNLGSQLLYRENERVLTETAIP